MAFVSEKDLLKRNTEQIYWVDFKESNVVS